MGKNLEDLLLDFQKRGNVPFQMFINRLHNLVYKEGMTLSDAINEIGRQTNKKLYELSLWKSMTENMILEDNQITPQDEDIFAANFMAVLMSI